MIYIKEIYVGFLKVQEKRYLERVKSDLKILKDVSCFVELVGKGKCTIYNQIFLYKILSCDYVISFILCFR